MNCPRLAPLWVGGLFVATAPVWIPLHIGLRFYLWLMDAEECGRLFNDEMEDSL